MSNLNQFKALSEWLRGALNPGEDFSLGYSAESSTFIRFNQAKVRQAGEVQQASLCLQLIHAGRHAELQLSLSGTPKVDRQRLADALQQLRQTLPLLPPDPYLQLNREAWHSHVVQLQPLPDSAAVLEQIGQAAQGLDLVGFYAAGPLSRGFASSGGAFGWHQASSFNFDWSLFHANGQALKAQYAGQTWQADAFARRLQQAREQLSCLGQPARSLAPGSYRAYLAPAALQEILELMSWGGFSARALADKDSPLQRLHAGAARLSPLLTLHEQVADSLTPAFSSEGYPRRDLSLIQAGQPGAQLVSARSAAEYGLPANGASPWESPQALAMAAGSLEQDEILARLGTGLYIGNLWYLNYSDRPAGRLTGMTRFASFWVEDGKLQAPLASMRFDDSLYELLGSQLEALTRERELSLSTRTYYQRHNGSTLLPGALLRRLTLTL
ncbi:metallopeptidase TldD-related protein [Pseudomonas sp. sp1636]|uniref:TldD/PmbA family protein n=1 Tax=Pseudomonas sp. sp1636 TaxID=3036707 RepID=UPI0025A59761|nr:metallopeptidase TldD-related protein [Pseudomonas sp. sp1636]MDM8350779.1 metallopeptidase TldD-related protein [Pseudomonas sp. sp1636]